MKSIIQFSPLLSRRSRPLLTAPCLLCQHALPLRRPHLPAPRPILPAFIGCRQINLTSPPHPEKKPKNPNFPHNKPAPDPSSKDTPANKPTPTEGRPDYTPLNLTHPLGLPYPPQPGQNSGIDGRTFAQRRKDFLNYDKHLEKRKRLTSEFGKSYFGDFNAMSKEYKGKGWVAPPAVFKAEKARYFPNLQGRTLVVGKEGRGDRDTTPVLRGKVSVVCVYSSLWGERQVQTWFMGGEGTGDIRYDGATLQKVEVNIEENWLKAWLVRAFLGGLRKRIKVEDHGRYFLVRRGLTDEIREEVGLLNARVGYVYLVDRECRVRWAGSGHARPEERAALRKCVDRLVREHEKWVKEEGRLEEIDGCGNVLGEVTGANEAVVDMVVVGNTSIGGEKSERGTGSV